MDSFCIHGTVDDEYSLLDEENANANRRKKTVINGNFSDNRQSRANGENISEINASSSESSLFLYSEAPDHDNSLLMRHGECHTTPKHNRDNVAFRKLLLISVICTLFMIAELIGGYIADSLAIMADAAHLFSDVVGFLVSLLSIWIGKKKPTNYMTFGFQRAEVLGAFLSILAIWVLAGIFCILAMKRMWDGDYDIEPNVMLIISSLGLIMNIIMAIVLHSSWWDNHSHGVSLGHSHSENINVRAAAAHVLGDIVQSLGVLIVAIIVKVSPSAKVLDPICTVAFSIIVVCVTVKVARDSLLILLQCSPIDVSDIPTMLEGVEGVKRVRDVRMWTLAPGNDVLTAHLDVDDFYDRDTALSQATYVINKRLKIVHTCLQVEKYEKFRTSNCDG